MKEQKIRFKRFASVVCVGLVLALTVSVANVQAAQEQSLRMASNVVGSLMYAVGAGVAQVIDKNSDLGVEVLPQGNVTSFPMFYSHETDLVVAASDEAFMAYNGQAVYDKMTKGKGIDMRMIMIGNPIEAGILVAKDSGITSGADLKGKRVTLDFGTHHALSMGARASLIGLGLSVDDVKTVKTTEVPAGMTLVMEGKADACFGSIGVPAFRELEAARGALYLGLDDSPETWAKIHEIFSGYYPARVQPSKAAIGVDKPMVLLGKNFTLVSRVDLDDEVAYTIAKTVWENEDQLGAYHPKLKGWKKGNFVSAKSPVPYHPGVIKFYKEVGVWTDEMQQHQEKLLAKK